MTTRDVAGQSGLWLATVPPTRRQRHLTIVAIAVVLALYGAVAPFAAMTSPQTSGLVPAVDSMIFVANLITAVFFLSNFSVSRSHAILLLANGYLFSALIIIPHALTFPGAFAPSGLLGARLPISGWFYFFWHFGFFLVLMCYAILKDGKRLEDDRPQQSTLPTIFWSIVIVISLVCALTWGVTMGNDFLPALFLSETNFIPWSHYIGALSILTGAAALLLLWVRRKSILDQWLMVTVCALMGEIALVGFFAPGGFNFYFAHVLAVVSSIVVLVALLAELIGLHARLLQSHRALHLERESKLLSVQVVASAIAHELNQPIAAIATEGNAARQFLNRANLEEVRVSLNAIVDDAARGSELLKNIRDLFSGDDHEMQAVDGTEIVLDALNVMREELKNHEITMQTVLRLDLPRIMGHKVQLRQVILNLLRNAVEALDSVTDRHRVVRVGTKHHGHDRIAITVEDSGPGIDPKIIDKIFDTFMTTKRSGMGLGLSLCRMIIERHGGHVLALPSTGVGARFQIILPVNVS
jgi:signal transduction histidine kinase